MTLNGILIGIVFSAVFAIFIYKVEEFIKAKRKKSEDENNLRVCLSGDAVEIGDKLSLEFKKLIREIALHHARSGEDLHLYVRKDHELREKLLIDQEDMEKAFLEAARLVLEKCALDCCPCKTSCDKQTVLQRVRNIRKNFEKIPQTP
jgi:hypothetical protein